MVDLSLIGISGCRQMKGSLISYIKQHREDSGLRTNKTHHGWQQTWLQWHQAQCNCTFFHGIRSLQNMQRMGNLRRQCSFSNKCNEKD